MAILIHRQSFISNHGLRFCHAWHSCLAIEPEVRLHHARWFCLCMTCFHAMCIAHCKNKLAVLPTVWLTWLHTSWRDSVNESFTLVGRLRGSWSVHFTRPTVKRKMDRRMDSFCGLTTSHTVQLHEHYWYNMYSRSPDVVWEQDHCTSWSWAFLFWILSEGFRLPCTAGSQDLIIDI